MDQPKRGGLLLRTEDGLRFLPASLVTSLAPLPPILRVAGAPEGVLGIVHENGEIMPVVAIGPQRAVLMVCSYLGEPIGLVGAEIVCAGLFEPDPNTPETLMYRGELAQSFDFSAIYTRLHTATWASRWTT